MPCEAPGEKRSTELRDATKQFGIEIRLKDGLANPRYVPVLERFAGYHLFRGCR